VLARLEALWLLERLFRRVALVPGVVGETVTQGKARGHADAVRIEAAVSHGQWVSVLPAASERRLAANLRSQAPALSKTDCITLACAKVRGLILLVEEQRGRHPTSAHGITFRTIQVLPLHGLIAEMLSVDECDSVLARIGQAMRTDQAIRAVLRASAGELGQLRSRRKGAGGWTGQKT
jgi:hypothetical protein